MNALEKYNETSNCGRKPKMAISPHNKSGERGHRPSRGRDGIKGFSVGVQTKTGVGTRSVHGFSLVISILLTPTSS